MNATEKAYLTLQNASGIKVGDTVKLLRKAESHEMGWKNTWCGDMDNYVGKTGVVLDVENCGIAIDFGDGNDFNYPFFVFEKVITVKKMTKKQFDELCLKTFNYLIEVE